MSNLTFQGHELPEALCQIIRSYSLKDIGLYKGEEHCFMTPTLDPKENDMRKIKAEYDRYDSLKDVNFNAVVNYVNSNTTVDPMVQSVQSIHTGVGDSTALKVLQHIELEEPSNAITHLLYLGSNRFLVLKTSRSTILAGDILQANSLPINTGEQELFSIIRNNKVFVPEKYTQYDTSFRTQEIIQIKLYTTPDLYKIIDEDEHYGEGAVLKNNLKEKNVIALTNAIKKVLDKNKAVLPNREQFPEYLKLLSVSKAGGIDCYTLNLLIECCECLRFDKTEYQICDDDWYYVLTIEQEEEIRIEKERKLRANYNEIYAKFKTELGEVRTRRVMLFFKAAGRVGNKAFIDEMVNKLDAFAEEGFGVKGEAKQMLLDAIANSKPKPGENLITAAKLVAVIVLALTVSWVWVTSKRNMEIFNYKIESADQVLAQGKYVEARDAYYLAYEEYRPKITAMLAQSKMNKRVEMLETALNEEIEAGIAQINAMRVADNGRFSKVAEDLMFRLLELDPQNSSLLELKNEWMNQ